MKQPRILLKTAVVASSLLLGSCFVAYHAGAFHRLAKPIAQPADFESSPTLENEPPNVDWEYSFTPPASGSSSAPEDKPSEGASQPAPTIMSGTKSFAPMHIISGLTPTDTSASDIVILPNPFAPDTAKQPPTAVKEPPATPKESKPAR